MINIDPTGNWCSSADGKWSRPGGCNGGKEGVEIFGNVGTSKYIDDSISINFGRNIIENGKVTGQFYPKNAFRIEVDKTGISNAFIGCAYDSNCLNFVTFGMSGILVKAPGMVKSVGNGFSKAWTWVQSFTAKYIGKKVDISKIKPNAYDEFSNPKIGPSQSALSKHKKYISEHGKIDEPILVKNLGNGNYEIINGHHRWEAARQMGLKK